MLVLVVCFIPLIDHSFPEFACPYHLLCMLSVLSFVLILLRSLVYLFNAFDFL